MMEQQRPRQDACCKIPLSSFSGRMPAVLPSPQVLLNALMPRRAVSCQRLNQQPCLHSCCSSLNPDHLGRPEPLARHRNQGYREAPWYRRTQPMYTQASQEHQETITDTSAILMDQQSSFCLCSCCCCLQSATYVECQSTPTYMCSAPSGRDCSTTMPSKSAQHHQVQRGAESDVDCCKQK